MANDVLIILDKCLERIRRGETVEQCLADYPDLRPELEPLLRVFKNVSTVRRVTPSTEFKQKAYVNILSRIEADSRQSDHGFKNIFNFNNLRRNLAFRTLVPVTIVVVLALIVWVALPVFSPVRVSAEECTLSVLSGSAEIKRTESSAWFPGNDGMTLKVGCRVRTPSDSYALLTFFDSSTIKLEPEAEVLINRSEYVDQRSTYIILEQQFGKTWSYVAPGSEQTYFAVHTPHGDAVAEGTAFSTEVDNFGNTKFTVAEGEIKVIEGNQEVHVEADKQIEVADKVALSAPLTVPPSENELVVSTFLPGVGSICDPNGASTGHFPDGLAFNQITNSKSVISNAGQQINVGEPISGEYLLAVRRSSNIDIPVNIQTKRNGVVVFQFNETLRGTNEEGWIIRIKLDTDGRADVSAGVISIEPLAGKAPENVIETSLAKKRAVPILPSGSQGNLPASTHTPENTTIIAASPAAVASGVPSDQGQSNNPPPAETPSGSSGGTPPSIVPELPTETTVPAIEKTPIDATAPEVISTNPERNAVEVDITEVLTASFSEDMNASDFNESTFTLSNNSTQVSGSVSYNTVAMTAVFHPESDLEFDTTYTARISRQVADLAGNKMTGSYTWSFTTSRRPDTIPPSVVSVSPENNTGDMAVNLVIKSVFSESMNVATLLDAGNFSLTAGGIPVDCEAVYDINTQTATFTPNASLLYQTTYTATLTTGITDAAGNHLGANYAWSFSTGIPSQLVTLSVGAPETAAEGSILDIKINVSEVADLSAFEFDLSYDKTVIQVLDDDSAVTRGMIDSNELEYDRLTWSSIQGSQGKLRVLGVIRGEDVNGSGYIVEVHFKVIGTAGKSSSLTLSKAKRNAHTNDYLFDNKSSTIATSVIGDLITVSP